jgi:hypothetical protein
MSKAVKIKICKPIVKPAVVFGSETWAVTEMDRKRLGAWEGTICGPSVLQGIWRIMTDQELRELYKHLDIAADVKKK